MEGQMTVVLRVSYDCENCGKKSSYFLTTLTGTRQQIEEQREERLVQRKLGHKNCPHCSYLQSWMMERRKEAIGTTVLAVTLIIPFLAAGLVALNATELACNAAIVATFVPLLAAYLATRNYHPNKEFGHVKQIKRPVIRTTAALAGKDPATAQIGHKCDVCGKATSEEEGTVFTASEFGEIVHKGFQPDESTIATMRFVAGMGKGMAGDLMGLSTGTPDWKLLENWRSSVKINLTDWLLCPGCAARARQYDSKAGEASHEETKAKICPSCGNRYHGWELYCDCGTRLVDSAAAPQSEAK